MVFCLCNLQSCCSDLDLEILVVPAVIKVFQLQPPYLVCTLPVTGRCAEACFTPLPHLTLYLWTWSGSSSGTSRGHSIEAITSKLWIHIVTEEYMCTGTYMLCLYICCVCETLLPLTLSLWPYPWNSCNTSLAKDIETALSYFLRCTASLSWCDFQLSLNHLF